MPTPLEILLDPITLTVVAVFAGLIALEAIFPAHTSPQSPLWRLKGSAGIFSNARNFACDNGFYPGASQRGVEMLLLRDVSEPRTPPITAAAFTNQ